MEKKKKKLSQKEYQEIKDKRNKNYVYFNVTESFLTTETTKTETWVYLTHARSVGSKQGGKSISSITKVNEDFNYKLRKPVYKQTLKSLEEKGLIKVYDIDEVENKIGFYQVDKAVEIVKKDDENYIPLPREIIDEKRLIGLDNKTIKDIIRLYKHYNVEDWGCIDVYSFNLTAKIPDYELGGKYTFGQGFSTAVYGKPIYEIQTVFNKNIYEISDEFYKSVDDELKDVNFINLNNLGLFTLTPLLFMVDKEDENIKKIIGEIYKGYVNGEDKYQWSLEENENSYPVVIWALKPRYPVRTKQYNSFLEVESTYKIKQKIIYTRVEESTKKEIRLAIIYEDEFYDYIKKYADNLNLGIHELNEMDKSFEKLKSKGYKHIYLDELDELNQEKEIELENIKNLNNKIKLETGKRSRKTTSESLKRIKKLINQNQKDIKEIESAENELIDVIPDRAFLEYYKYFYYDYND